MRRAHRGRRGPARGGSDLTILVEKRQIRTPSHAIGADVSPRLSDLGRPLELNARQGTIQERRSELSAVKQEVGQAEHLWRRTAPRNFHGGRAACMLPSYARL